MRILEIGPSETRARGGMSEVIRSIRESEVLGGEFQIDSFPSYIDGSLPVRLLYSVYGCLRFLTCFKKYDLFHIHTAERGSTFRKSIYLRIVNMAGKKAIVHIHGAEYLTFFDRLEGRKKRAVEKFFRRADMVLALSEGWKRELESRFQMKACETLYNGVDTERFQTAVSDPEEHKDSFLMLGRLGERKGTYDLITAAERAIKINPNITLCLAGDGEVERVRAMVKEKGLEKNITVPGWIDAEEKLRCLREAATLVLPSYNEGLPVAVLEAMAAGKAIISTAVGAVPEAVDADNGIIIVPGDISALTQALLRCSTDVKELARMSENNRRKAENIFSLPKTHGALAEYYRRAAKQEA